MRLYKIGCVFANLILNGELTIDVELNTRCTNVFGGNVRGLESFVVLDGNGTCYNSQCEILRN